MTNECSSAVAAAAVAAENLLIRPFGVYLFFSLYTYAKSRNKDAFGGDPDDIDRSIDRSIMPKHVYECVYDLIVVVSARRRSRAEGKAYNLRAAA